MQKYIQHIDMELIKMHNSCMFSLVWLVYCCFTLNSTIFQSYMRRHRCVGGLKKKLYLRSGSNRHRNFAGFLNMPVLHRHGPPFLYGDSDTPPHLVTFYDTLGIRRTYSRLNPPPPPRRRQFLYARVWLKCRFVLWKGVLYNYFCLVGYSIKNYYPKTGYPLFFGSSFIRYVWPIIKHLTN